MNPGTYKAFVVDKVISQTRAGDPQAVIQVDVEVGNGETRRMNYYGSFKDKAAEFTIKALVACGLRGNSPTDPVTPGTEVSVVVVEDKDLNDKLRLKIAWINKPMSLGEAMEPSRAKASLAKFEGAIAALRNKEPKIKNYAPGADTTPSFDSSEEIPF